MIFVTRDSGTIYHRHGYSFSFATFIVTEYRRIDVCWQYNSVLKEVLKAHCDLINDQIKYYLKICTLNLFFNLSYITIKITAMFHLLVYFKINK